MIGEDAIRNQQLVCHLEKTGEQDWSDATWEVWDVKEDGELVLHTPNHLMHGTEWKREDVLEACGLIGEVGIVVDRTSENTIRVHDLRGQLIHELIRHND